MKVMNKHFSFIVSGYKMPYSKDNNYYENNWLKGFVKINSITIFKFEFLQVEEVVELSKWIERFENQKKPQVKFEFIDPYIKFKSLRKNGFKSVKFICPENDNPKIYHELSIDNIGAFGKEISLIINKFPVR